MESVSLNALDFKTLEKDIYEASCKYAREVMNEVLEKDRSEFSRSKR